MQTLLDEDLISRQEQRELEEQLRREAEAGMSPYEAHRARMKNGTTAVASTYLNPNAPPAANARRDSKDANSKDKDTNNSAAESAVNSRKSSLSTTAVANEMLSRVASAGH